jgi:hypothetical protein
MRVMLSAALCGCIAIKMYCYWDVLLLSCAAVAQFHKVVWGIQGAL